ASLAAVLATAPAFAQKPRVAVMNFDYATVSSTVHAIFGTNADVGKGIADLLVNELVSDGTFQVIERKMLDKIIAEQNLSNSDRADANSAAKIGRILGVDAIVIGSITQFGRDDRNTKVGGFGRSLGGFGVGGLGLKNSKAVVGITARLVSTDTAEILAVASGTGESKRSGTSLLGAGGEGVSAGGGNIDMGSSNFANSILGEATKQATTALASQLRTNAARIPAKLVTIDALIADVTGNTVIINTGSRAGVKVGDKLAVKRTGREIRDPATGKVLRKVEEDLGEITITEVDEGSAVGNFSGAGKPRVGDSAKSIR
ncbi:MAG TPA: CsgG/HfaB family protein, partial [Bryobacteraceae bacterium]|nr:CsgG/HfaB family protein [Bryobacteraceae bacterium]